MTRLLVVSLVLFSCAMGSQVDAQTVDPEEILAAHNKWRGAVGVEGLVWSPELAALAQDWADQNMRANTCFDAAHRQGSQYGENLAMSQPAETATAAIDGWGRESQSYDYDTNSCAPGAVCGHYTQVVWRATREVGCGVATCADGSAVWVCNYNPGGNYTGERPY